MATFTWASLTRPLAPISFVPAAPPRSPSPPPNHEEGQKAKDFYESIVDQKPNISDGYRRRNTISDHKCPRNISDKLEGLGTSRSDDDSLEVVKSGRVASAAANADEPVAGTSYDILIDDDSDNDDWRRRRNRPFEREPQIDLSSSPSSSSRIPHVDSSRDLKVKIEDEDEDEDGCDVKVKVEQNPSDPRFENRLEPQSIAADAAAAAAATTTTTERFPRPDMTTTTKSNAAFEAKRMRYRFFSAAQNDDLAELDLCLRNGVGANELDDFGWSALMIASSGGSLNVARHLVEIGADKSISTSGGLTALGLIKGGKFDSERKDELTELLRESANEDDDNDDDDDITIETTVAGSSSSTTEVIQFCEVCDSCYAEAESAHLQSVSHLLRSGGVEGGKKQDLSVFGIGEGNRGFRLMVDTMGWDANSGLGKEGEGRRYPIKTQPKSDRKGLGVDKEKQKTEKDSSKKESSESRLGRGVAARLMTQRTLSRKEARREEIRNKRWEKNLRRYLSE